MPIIYSHILHIVHTYHTGAVRSVHAKVRPPNSDLSRLALKWMKWPGINETLVFGVKQPSLHSPYSREHSVLMDLVVAGTSVLAEPTHYPSWLWLHSNSHTKVSWSDPTISAFDHPLVKPLFLRPDVNSFGKCSLLVKSSETRSISVYHMYAMYASVQYSTDISMYAYMSC